MLTVVLLLALSPVAGQVMGQGRQANGPNRPTTFAYSRKGVSFEAVGKKKPVQATLTLPRKTGPSPAVIFVTGAWAAEHDGESDAEDLRSLADYLGEHGVAVLQLKTPIGGRSTADLNSAGAATFETDIRAGLAYLRQRPEIDPKQIGLFGLNENGAIATVTATMASDVSFLILAGTPIVEYAPSSLATEPVNGYDLRPLLSRVTCPVLVLQGDQDRTAPARENMAAYRAALLDGKSHDAAFVMLPGLNRSLETTIGNGRSESEMAPLALRTVTGWVYRHTTGQDFAAGNPVDDNGKEETRHRKPSNPYGDVPGGVIGQFRFRREVEWFPAIGNQPRPYGYWYW